MDVFSLDWKRVVILVVGVCMAVDTCKIDSNFEIGSAYASPTVKSSNTQRKDSESPAGAAPTPTREVILLHDENLDGVPDEAAEVKEQLLGSDTCKISDATCALSFVMMQIPQHAKVLLRAKKKCPTRRIKRVVTSAGKVVRQNVSPHSKKRCKKPARKPTNKPTATPKPKVTATPTKGDPLPAPSPEPTRVPTATPSGGGNAATGRSFYTQVCTSCHGVKGGKSEQQVLAAMSSISQHSSVKGLVSSQTAKDIAAYLATVR
jgi:hypothetical protein